MSLWLIDDAKVRRFWEMEKYLPDFCLKLWRQGQGSATKRRQSSKIVSRSQEFCLQNQIFTRIFMGLSEFLITFATKR